MEPATTPEAVNTYLNTNFPGTGNECVEIGARHAIGRFTVDPSRLRPGGYISGPTQFGLADAVLWYALFGAVRIEPMAVTSELSIRYLRPAIGSVLYARADLSLVAKRSVVGTVGVWVDDRAERLVSVAQGTYIRPPSTA
jgi:uncharacterized protein (TIGR00369 family)